ALERATGESDKLAKIQDEVKKKYDESFKAFFDLNIKAGVSRKEAASQARKFAQEEVKDLEKALSAQEKKLQSAVEKLNRELQAEEKKQQSLASAAAKQLSREELAAKKAEELAERKRIAAERAAQKAQEAQSKSLSKELEDFQKTVAAELKELEKVQQAKASAAKTDAQKVTSPLGGLGDVEKITTAISSPIAAIGLLIEKFQQLSEGAKKSIGEIGEKFSEFIIGLSEGKVSVDSFVNSIKGNIASLGEEFGFVGTAAAQFNNVLISGFQAFTNIVKETAKEQRVFRGLTQTLGLSTESLKIYEQALVAAGLPTENLRLILLGVSQSLEKLNQGEERQSQAFRKLKLSAEDFIGLNADEKFKLIFERIKELNAVNKEAAADVAGVVAGSKRYVEQLDLIGRNAESGRAAVRAFRAAVSDDLDKDLAKFDSLNTDLGNIFTGITNSIAERFTPELIKLAEQLKQTFLILKADPKVVAFFESVSDAIVTTTRAIGVLILDAQLLFQAFVRIGDAVPPIKSLTDAFNSLFGVSEEVKKANEGLAKQQKEQKEAEEVHEKTLKALGKEYVNFKQIIAAATKEVKASTDITIAAIESEAEAGKISAIEGSRRILEEKRRLNSELIDLAAKNVLKTAELAQIDVKFIEEAEAAKANFVKTSADAVKAEEEALKNFKIATSQEIIKKTEEEKKNRIKNNKEAINEINKLENEGKKSHEEAAKERNAITRDEILKEIEINKSLADDLRLTAKARGDARKEVSKLTVELADQDLKAEKEANAAKRKDDKETADQKKQQLQEETKLLLDNIKLREAKAKGINDLEQQNINTIVEKFTKGEISKQEAIRQTTLASIDANKARIVSLTQDLTALEKAKTLEGADVLKFEDDIAKKNQEINNLKRQTLELEDLLKGKVKSTSEAQKKVLDNLGSSGQEQEKSQERQIDNQNTLNDAISKTQGKVLSVNQTFDATTATIEQTIKRIADLRADANQILLNGQSATQGRIDAAFTFFDTASDLERKLGERILKESVEAQRKANEERARITAEADAGIKEKIQEGLEEQADDRREYNKTIKELNKDLEENAQETADEIVDIQNDSDAKIQKIFSDAREKEAKERATEIDRIKAERRQLEIDLRKIDEDARKDKAKREADAIVDRAALNKAVRDAQELVDKGGTEEERAAAKKALEEAQAKLAEFDKKNKGREAAEAEKNKKIKEAEQLLAKEKGEATTEEEIKAAEARFKARKEAAEKGLQDELDFQDQLAELQETGSEEEKAALIKKIEEIRKINKEAEAARLKDIDEQLALEKALRAKAEAERQAEIAKQVEEEENRAKEAIDRLREQGAKREEEIRKQIDKESKQFEKAEAERNAKIAQAIAEVSAGLQLASSQLSDYVTNLAKSLGLAADKIKPIADAIAQINNATKTNSTSSSSTSNPSSNPSNPSNPSSTGNNPFSSPTGSDPNAGNLGNFRQQAPNNQGNQQGQQNNNSPSSPPASPNNSPASPNNSPSGPSSNTGNTGISASSNQANQNSESNNNIASDGSPSDDDQFRSEMSKIFDSLLKAAKQTTKPKDLQNLKNKTLESTDLTKGAYINNKYKNFISKYEKLKPIENPQLFNFGETNYQNALLKSSQKRFFGIQELNKEKFMNGVEIAITGINRRLAEIVNQIKLLGLEQGLKDTVEADIDSSPTDVDTGSNPNQPSGGRGNNPGPRSPGAANPVKPNIPNSGGLTDKEKAFFAGRDKDANTGFDEAEASGLAGRRGLRPDAAVGGNANNTNAGNADNPANQSGQSQNQSQNPFGSNEDPNDTSNAGFDDAGEGQGQGQTINQTNNSSITNNYYLSGILTDKKTQDEIMSLMQKREEQVQQEMQQKLRNLAGPNLLR
ncbi:MAG: hypothetical protein WAQ98_25525, partial [Blastocatellia bacterium]